MELQSFIYVFSNSNLQQKILQMTDDAKKTNVRVHFKRYDKETKKLYYLVKGKSANIEIFKNCVK
jgi:hypothetical protein